MDGGGWNALDDARAEWRRKLARIREAVAAERVAAEREKEEYTMWHVNVARYGMNAPESSPNDVNHAERVAAAARVALDALLAREVE